MNNPLSVFKNYIASNALAEAKDEFERARIDLLVHYCMALFLLSTPFLPVLFLKNLIPQFIINCAAIATLPFLLYLIKHSKIFAASVAYIAIQFLTSFSHLALASFQLSVQSTLWSLLHILFSFFVLGNRWGMAFSLLTMIVFSFGVVNTASGLAYFNAHVPLDHMMSEDELINIIIPFAMNIYILKEFVRTRTVAEIALRKSRERSEELLLNILPAETAAELKSKGHSDAKYYEDVTVLFADIKNFSALAESLPPQQLVNELHECFKGFDEIISAYSIEKIKTIGDAYLCASGMQPKSDNPAEQMVKAALQMVTFINERKSKSTFAFDFRIGIHTGPIVAGVVGVKKFAFDIWGDTVNTAARMEQNSEVGKINISEATYKLVNKTFDCSYRGEFNAKNKGMLKMYFVS